MKKPKFILSGGGTGGHIYPAIAIANELKRRFPTAEFLFVGAENRMEMQKVPQAGYPIKGLWISGIQRKLSLDNLAFPFKLLSSLLKSKKILNQFKPDVVIGTGGFASGPLLKMANAKKIPTLLQEQNSYAGITNKWLADKADVICVAYKGMERYFPKEKIVFTGNPVRQDLLEISGKTDKAKQVFKLTPEKQTILILGGSLGARRINQEIAKQIAYFKTKDIQLIWQTGKLYYDEYKKYNSENIRVFEFLNEMDLAYAAADIIISRAGAGTVSELAIVGKPVVFIPSPNVAEDHQTKNAMAMVENNAAVCIREESLEEDFCNQLTTLLNNPTKQKALSENLKHLAKPKATKVIVDHIEKLLKK
ncbi:MAG: undecaprenyldiphospho-muramoylpentapeptide beta-N-acetylglucosaminyltransferase [Mesonia hippocampi]|uniref:undecaprenyldiphospho-muramoylpentapeptide beta-N-acetylglucosaminyltransferase n=1 Tax=Mesonia hippocampi TaxID=1628250 RepID=UPI003F94949B